jgi:outer membrane protein assembly factor BamB
MRMRVSTTISKRVSAGLFALLAGTASIGLGAGSALATTPVAWPQIDFSPALTSFNPHETTITPANVNQLTVQWHTAVDSDPSSGGGGQDSPTVAGGDVFVGTELNHVQAYRVSDGHLAWSVPVNSSSLSSPAVAGGVVVGASPGSLVGIKETTGKILWRKSLVFNGSPTISGGVIYIGDEQGNLYADKVSTGKPVWKHKLTSQGIFGTAAVVAGEVYVGANNGCVYALRASTGHKDWSFCAKGIAGNTASPSVTGGVVYVGSSGSPYLLYAINASTGKKIWTAPVGASVLGAPSVAYGNIYVGTRTVSSSSQTGSVIAFDQHNWQQVWTQPTQGAVEGAVTLAGGLAFAADTSGNVYAFNAASGGSPLLTWSDQSIAPGNGFFTQSPTVVNGHVYVMDEAPGFGTSPGYLYELG